MYKARVEELDAEYERICLGKDSPLKAQEYLRVRFDSDLVGTGWKLYKRSRLSHLRTLDASSPALIFARLSCRRAYRISLLIDFIDMTDLPRLEFRFNDRCIEPIRLGLEGCWRATAILSAGILEESRGLVKIAIRVVGHSGPAPLVLVSGVEAEPIPVTGESVLRQHGLSYKAYAEFGDLNPSFRELLNNCPPEALVDSDKAKDWIQQLDRQLPLLATRDMVPSLEDDSLSLAEGLVGTGWGDAARWGDQTYRWLGSACSCLLIRVSPACSHRLKTYIYTAPPNGVEAIQISVNGVHVLQGLSWEAGQYVIWFDVSATLVAGSFGRLEIAYRISDDHDLPVHDFAFTRLVATPIADSEAAEPISDAAWVVLERAGLSCELYASYRELDGPYREEFNACPDEAVHDPVLAASWIEKLDRRLSSEVFWNAETSVPDRPIKLADRILGTGWGRTGLHGEQSFRWLACPRPRLFLKLEPALAYRIKTCIYTCPQELLEGLRVDVNDSNFLDQGIAWEVDRFVHWCDVPAELLLRSAGQTRITYILPNDNQAGGQKIAFTEVLIAPLRTRGEAQGRLPSFKSGLTSPSRSRASQGSG